MPSYTYECPKCGDLQDIIKSVDDCKRKERCPECRSMMQRIFQPPNVIADTYTVPKVMAAYESIRDGRMGAPDVVHSRGEHERWLREYNRTYKTNLDWADGARFAKGKPITTESHSNEKATRTRTHQKGTAKSTRGSGVRTSG